MEQRLQRSLSSRECSGPLSLSSTRASRWWLQQQISRRASARGRSNGSILHSAEPGSAAAGGVGSGAKEQRRRRTNGGDWDGRGKDKGGPCTDWYRLAPYVLRWISCAEARLGA